MKQIHGVVIKSTGSWYAVRRDDAAQTVVQCRIVGKFRLDKMNLTNPVAVGDKVVFDMETEGKGVIKQILPRQNYIARQSPHRRHDIHLLAANIDQAILFTTLVEPNIKLGFLDRFLLMTEPHNVPTVLVFNKCDLWDAETWTVFADLKAVYEAIGYTVLAISARRLFEQAHRTETGLNEPSSLLENKLSDLADLLQGKTSMISGQSGVGKSTIVNALEPELALLTGDISDYSGKGQHTTTFAEMHPLSISGYLIDTPGIKTLTFNNLEPMDVAHNFREFFELSDDCRFGSSCTHRNEPHCAVKKAVEAETIAASRYENYLKIIEEIEDINYWERHKRINH
jgi:ribosome biogenesis GTPase